MDSGYHRDLAHRGTLRLGYAMTEPAMHNDVAVGVVILLGSLVWGFSELRRYGLSSDTQAQRR